jgi:hypothetical protein
MRSTDEAGDAELLLDGGRDQRLDRRTVDRDRRGRGVCRSDDLDR